MYYCYDYDQTWRQHSNPLGSEAPRCLFLFSGILSASQSHIIVHSFWACITPNAYANELVLWISDCLSWMKETYRCEAGAPKENNCWGFGHVKYKRLFSFFSLHTANIIYFVEMSGNLWDRCGLCCQIKWLKKTLMIFGKSWPYVWLHLIIFMYATISFYLRRFLMCSVCGKISSKTYS